MQRLVELYLITSIPWKWSNVNSSSIYTAHVICAHKYSVAGRREGDIAMRQYILLLSEVTIYFISNKSNNSDNANARMTLP